MLYGSISMETFEIDYRGAVAAKVVGKVCQFCRGVRNHEERARSRVAFIVAHAVFNFVLIIVEEFDIAIVFEGDVEVVAVAAQMSAKDVVLAVALVLSVVDERVDGASLFKHESGYLVSVE